MNFHLSWCWRHLLHCLPSSFLMSWQLGSKPLLSHHPFPIPKQDLTGMIKSLVSQVQESSSVLFLHWSPRLRARMESQEPTPKEMRRLYKPTGSLQGGFYPCLPCLCIIFKPWLLFSFRPEALEFRVSIYASLYICIEIQSPIHSLIYPFLWQLFIKRIFPVMGETEITVSSSVRKTEKTKILPLRINACPWNPPWFMLEEYANGLKCSVSYVKSHI